MMSSVLVNVRDLHKVYHRGGERIDVLQGVNLDIPEGDFLALMGPSGSGKTTLLNLLGGLDTPSEGSITVGGDRIDKLAGGRLSAWRARHIGFVFQLYNLLPVLTAARNVELPLLLTKLSKADRQKRVQVALSVVGLADRMNHFPRQLSGGQEQRVGIARAIVTDPTLLLCDEPTGDLDRKSGDEVLDLLQALNKRARQDHRDGHPRPARRGARPPDAAPRKRRARRGGGGMKFFPLVWRNLLRRKVRTTFTLLSVFVAFVLFGILMAIRVAFGAGVTIAGAERLMMIDKISLINPIPLSLHAADPVDRRSGRPVARELVRRHLPGSEELLRQHGGRPRELAADLSGVRAAGGPEEGLAGRSHRRHRRRRHGATVRLEGRRPRAAPGRDLPHAGRRARGSSRSTASTTRRRRASTSHSSSSTTTT